jgi:hypothetical protein
MPRGSNRPARGGNPEPAGAMAADCPVIGARPEAARVIAGMRAVTGAQAEPAGATVAAYPAIEARPEAARVIAGMRAVTGAQAEPAGATVAAYPAIGARRRVARVITLEPVVIGAKPQAARASAVARPVTEGVKDSLSAIAASLARTWVAVAPGRGLASPGKPAHSRGSVRARTPGPKATGAGRVARA